MTAAAQPVICGECGAPMQLSRGGYGPFWSCTRWPRCAGTHGAHSDGRPLGIPASAVTRRARIQAHAAFDQLWCGTPRMMKRQAAYRWMQQAMQLSESDAHMGSFTVEQCDRLIRLVTAHLEEHAG